MTARRNLDPGVRVVVYDRPVLRDGRLATAELIERLGPQGHPGAGLDRWRARMDDGEEREILVDRWTPEIAA